MAPELLKGKPSSPASDFWAVGVVLYEFLYGVKPFSDTEGKGDVDVIFNQILENEPEYFEGEIS